MAGTATPTPTRRSHTQLSRSDVSEEWLAGLDQPSSPDGVDRPALGPREIGSASEDDEMTTSKQSQPAARRRGELHRAIGDRQVGKAIGARRRLNALPLRPGRGS
jgi:hypothetical protein